MSKDYNDEQCKYNTYVPYISEVNINFCMIIYSLILWINLYIKFEYTALPENRTPSENGDPNCSMYIFCLDFKCSNK